MTKHLLAHGKFAAYGFPAGTVFDIADEPSPVEGVGTVWAAPLADGSCSLLVVLERTGAPGWLTIVAPYGPGDTLCVVGGAWDSNNEEAPRLYRAALDVDTWIARQDEAGVDLVAVVGKEDGERLLHYGGDVLTNLVCGYPQGDVREAIIDRLVAMGRGVEVPRVHPRPKIEPGAVA